MTTTISMKRPIGTVHVEITYSADGKTKLSRTVVPDVMGVGTTDLTVETPVAEAISMIKSWADGEYAQNALRGWSAETREWLITGFLPGTDMNPLGDHDVSM